MSVSKLTSPDGCIANCDSSDIAHCTSNTTCAVCNGGCHGLSCEPFVCIEHCDSSEQAHCSSSSSCSQRNSGYYGATCEPCTVLLRIDTRVSQVSSRLVHRALRQQRPGSLHLGQQLLTVQCWLFRLDMSATYVSSVDLKSWMMRLQTHASRTAIRAIKPTASAIQHAASATLGTMAQHARHTAALPTVTATSRRTAFPTRRVLCATLDTTGPRASRVCVLHGKLLSVDVWCRRVHCALRYERPGQLHQ